MPNFADMHAQYLDSLSGARVDPFDSVEDEEEDDEEEQPAAEVKPEVQHTAGPWREGKAYAAVVADTLPDGALAGSDHVEHYGGYLIAESIARCNRPVIAAAPMMHDLIVALPLRAAQGAGDAEPPRKVHFA